MSLTDEQIAEIKARLGKTTPGPWASYGSGPFEVFQELSSGDPDDAEYVTLGAHREPDADFIAHARQDVPALLAEVERLKAERQRAIDALNEPGRDAVATSGDLEDGINMDAACRSYEQADDTQRQEINRLKDGMVALIRAWRAHDDDTGDYGRCADEAEGLLNGGAWC